MVSALLGKKLGMTRLFTEDGRWIPVTVLEAGPVTVMQVKTHERDGYEAVQLGFGDIKESRLTKPVVGHQAKAGGAFKHRLREVPLAPDSEIKQGDEIRVDIFAVGDYVDVAATTKGKGFAGVQKRHRFKGGPRAHGSNFHRAPGSIGQSADPSKVVKGKRLPGRMGNVRRTVQNLEVVKVDLEKNLLVVRGAVPGANGAYVEVKKRLKGTK
ncbi:MAG: 50S ribosomal protein L3 [Candidatus Hydrogenedentes bacterium]|nr:50S ribosomal protein L3 [Candidatus Hydrogenedentota bacterium]